MGDRLTPYKCFLLPIGSDSMDFKDKLIILLVKGLITSIVMISIVFGLFIHSYFWSDYNVLNSNSNLNYNTNQSPEGDEE